VNVIKSMYAGVKMMNSVSNKFEVKVRVHQGSVGAKTHRPLMHSYDELE